MALGFSPLKLGAAAQIFDLNRQRFSQSENLKVRMTFNL